MRHLTEHLVAETEYLWANVGAGITEAGIVLIDCPVRPSDSRHWQKELRALSPKGPSLNAPTFWSNDEAFCALIFIE